MQVKKIKVRNFRLLQDTELCLDEHMTLIVGRNNSGKTSLAELFRRLLSEKTAGFRLEDFSLASHSRYWDALQMARQHEEEAKVRATLPSIEVTLTVGYDKSATSFGPLADFIVDLNPDCVEARIDISYQLDDGKLKLFFDEAEVDSSSDEVQQKTLLLHKMKELVPKHYSCKVFARDPNDPSNERPLEWSKLSDLIQGNLVSAHRGIDDITHKESDSLSRILSSLFESAEKENSSNADQLTVNALKDGVKGVQESIDKSFNGQLTNLLPALNLFGYKFLAPKIQTETNLDVGLLLRNHTKIRYSGGNGVSLPEAYNGLGTRNLIYILLKLFEAYKSFKARGSEPGMHLMFIEEPEAHLHPQMQEVFVDKLEEIAKLFASQYGDGQPWPVQFVVTTHSPHMANKAEFDSIRYFLATPDIAGFPRTKVKDLQLDFGDRKNKSNEFLHQYMTLTRCDLLFADKVILIEGTSERLLLPVMIGKVDIGLPDTVKLGSQYISVLEVGGAYSHIFFRLLDFLELPALIITDLDSVDAAGEACKVSEGISTSNASIKDWFGLQGVACSPADLLAKTEASKIKNMRRLAYQVPEPGSSACGRSLEGAFMLANTAKFSLDDAALEISAWKKAAKAKKSEFALKHAISDTDWKVPHYIGEGLSWLATVAPETAKPETSPVAGQACKAASHGN